MHPHKFSCPGQILRNAGYLRTRIRTKPEITLVGFDGYDGGLREAEEGNRLRASPVSQSVLQVVRVTLEEQSGALLNHSALVDRCHEVVTYYVTSHTNLTSAVLFDMKNGLICYKPESRDACFLQKMETSDFENVHTLLNMSQHKVNHFWLPGNKTRWQTEFLGVLGGSGVDAMTLEEPLQALCQHGPIYWARRADGPGKQRLIYFCIDICFPSNVCVSVCFYYLPE